MYLIHLASPIPGTHERGPNGCLREHLQLLQTEVQGPSAAVLNDDLQAMLFRVQVWNRHVLTHVK